ncbi:type II/IV secretion system protein [Puniceicoccales bacterium CK1056]|uniref:Type II/IV secretion system protein n=1 Tax=Oceanipulchritudo coccoides TaxID=2706888 RepID=A0A6B2LZX7_9BACT|nr:GspE/PulE family protein [Oceanipulchritudo coccoides]NDV61327.1 type II/IV secretion system protein [Oceanipulchritudo coccoides]
MAIPRVLRSVLRELVLDKKLDKDAVQEITSENEDLSGDELETILHEKYEVPAFSILLAQASAFSIPPFNAKNFTVNERTFERLDKDFCRENKVLPIGTFGTNLVVVIADPFNTELLETMQNQQRCSVYPMLGLEEEILQFLQKENEVQRPEGFGDVMESLNIDFDEVNEDGDISEEDLENENSPIVQLASRIIEDAYFSGGSDIHVEPFENEARIRVRVDGVCQDKLRIPAKAAISLMARLKIMANLDIAEKRLPQDGRIIYKQFNRKGIDVDLRVATAPLNHGEGAVMRLLDKQKSTLPLTALGFSEDNLSMYKDLITRPYGMVLHCGPTGSGKSMTLYSALNEINDPGKCIRTAEDPIEYTLNGLLQMQMHRQIGLTFAKALRAFLRQDPDIILVGEIRDQETAQIAVEAALTGHMLFSTLHTNDAPSTISRLTEMKIEPFMISASLVCVCAQRLLRRVCKTCGIVSEAENRERDILERAIDWSGDIPHHKEGGCPACGGIGYKGRVGIHELMPTSNELIKGINAGMDVAKLKRIAVRNRMRTLHQDSMLKVQDGTTTIEEAIANVPPDMEDLRAIKEAPTLEQALMDLTKGPLMGVDQSD